MFQVSTTADSSILAICGGVLSDLWAASGSYPWLTAAYLLGPILLGGLAIMVMDFRPRPGGMADRLLRGARRLLAVLGFERAYGWTKQRWLFRRADRALIAFALAGFVAAGSFLGWKIVTGAGPQQRALASGEVATPFSLTDHNGRTITAESFTDKYALVSFGYTFCPDVCPTTLNTLSVTLDILGARADSIVTAFITIDPQRDTVDVLHAYVANFNSHILGLTGTPEHIRTLTRAYRVYYARAPGSKPDDPDYLMEHSAGIYLIGPDGGIVQTFPHNAAAEDIAAAVKSVLPAAPVS